jgi:hypothetical protein
MGSVFNQRPCWRGIVQKVALRLVSKQRMALGATALGPAFCRLPDLLVVLVAQSKSRSTPLIGFSVYSHCSF